MSNDTKIDMEKLLEQSLDKYGEVPGLLEWQLPIGAAGLRLVAEGRPLTIEAIASVLGWPVEEVKARLDDWGVSCDSNGCLNIPELESAPEGVPLPVYRIRWLDTDTGQVGEVPGCAPDAVGAVLMAGRPAQIELPCPATGRLVSLRVGAGGSFEGVDPAGAVAIMESPDSDWHPANWSRADCADGLLFASAEAASGWLAGHPGYIAVPMEFFVRYEARFFDRVLAQTPPPNHMQKVVEKDNFTEGWKKVFQAWVPAVRVVLAVFKLTNAGEKPVALNELVAVAGFSTDETASLVSQFFSGEARIQDGLVHLEMATTRQPSSRFEIRIGDRVLYAGGCVPDQFWMAYFSDEPVEIRGTCQATGVPISVIVSATGVETVEPAEVVVGIMNPVAVQAVELVEEFDEQVCIHQLFFASMDAGAAWKRQHPQGRLFPVRELFDFDRQLLAPITGDLMTTVNPSKKG